MRFGERRTTERFDENGRHFSSAKDATNAGPSHETFAISIHSAKTAHSPRSDTPCIEYEATVMKKGGNKKLFWIFLTNVLYFTKISKKLNLLDNMHCNPFMPHWEFVIDK